MSGPRILNIDIETAPIKAHVWGLRDQNIGLNQILENPRMMGFGAAWDGDKAVKWFSEYHHGRDAMLHQAHRLLDEADAVVHYNGTTFDVPWINAELAVDGMAPPSPFKNIDLYKVIRKNFRFPSYKLQYVAGRLLGESKLETGGHQLWVDCLEGDDETKKRAWDRMARYCKQDVRLLPHLKTKLLPWLPNLLNPALFREDGVMACTKTGCGSTDLEKRGFSTSAQAVFQQYRCRVCGGWSKDTKALYRVHVTGVTS